MKRIKMAPTDMKNLLHAGLAVVGSKKALAKKMGLKHDTQVYPYFSGERKHFSKRQLNALNKLANGKIKTGGTKTRNAGAPSGRIDQKHWVLISTPPTVGNGWLEPVRDMTTTAKAASDSLTQRVDTLYSMLAAVVDRLTAVEDSTSRAHTRLSVDVGV